MDKDVGILVLMFVVFALFIGASTRHLLKRSSIPYTVALLIVGLGIGLAERFLDMGASLPAVSQTLHLVSNIDPHLLMFLFLPTLIFESAFAVEVHLFRRIFLQIVILAVPGLIVSIAVTALLVKMALPFEWSWPIAFMFGALISATDPIAVVALLKEVSSRKRLETLIEGESLLNDGTAIVFFSLFYALAMSGGEEAFTLAGVSGSFIWVVSLGLIIGLLLGWLALGWIGRIFNDSLIEITISIVAAYLVFFIAEGLFHVSGVVAVVALALYFASIGRTRISPEVAEFVHQFWEVMAYVANTLIFLIVGILIAERLQFDSFTLWMSVAALYVGITAIRAFSIALFMPVLGRVGIGITREKAIVLWWGGLRGAVSLTLALLVVQDTAIPAAVRDEILFLCAGIVVLTIVVNGGSMGWVLHKLGLDVLPAAKQATVDKAKGNIRIAVSGMLDELKQNEFLQNADWNKVKDNVAYERIAQFGDGDANVAAREEDLLIAFKRRLLETERKNYWAQYKEGMIGRNTANRLNEAVEQALDGTPTISPRASLWQFMQMPKRLLWVKTVPVLNSLFARSALDRLALSYDMARGFIHAQDEISQHIDRLAPGTDEAELVRQEILRNKKDTYLMMEQLRASFPEVINGLETLSASRLLLNRERKVIQELLKSAVLDKPEAARMINDVENRMADLQMHRNDIVTVDASNTVRQMEWLKGLPEETVETILQSGSTRIFSAGEAVCEKGSQNAALLIVLRGSVEVIEGETILDVSGNGTVLGAQSLMTGQWNHTVRACTPAELLILGAEKLRPIMAATPALATHISRLVTSEQSNDT